MRYLWLFVLMVFIAVMIVSPVYAGVLGNVKSWVMGEGIAWIATAILVFLTGIFAVMSSKIIRTFKEAGEFLVVLGTALEDKKVTREEIGSIIKEGTDIFAIWGSKTG